MPFSDGVIQNTNEADEQNTSSEPHPLEMDDVPEFRGNQEPSALEQFLDNDGRLTVQALHQFTAEDILQNWDRAKENYYLGHEEEVSPYAEKYGTPDDYGSVSPNDVMNKYIGSDSEFADIVVRNMQLDSVGQHWHDLLAKGPTDFTAVLWYGDIDRRHFAEHLDLLTEEEIAKLPEDYVDRVIYDDREWPSSFLASYWRGSAQDYGKLSASDVGFDTPSAETIGSLLSHGADPNMLALAMANGPHYYVGADRFGWGLPLVTENFNQLKDNGFDTKTFLNDVFGGINPDNLRWCTRNSIDSNFWPSPVFQEAANYIPALVEAGADFGEIFAWAQPIAATAHDLFEKSETALYHNEIECALTDCLDIAIQRGQINDEVVDFLTDYHQGANKKEAARATGILVEKLPELQNTTGINIENLSIKLANLGGHREMFNRFDELVHRGMDPMELATTIAASDIGYHHPAFHPERKNDSIKAKLEQLGLQLDHEKTASKAAVINPEEKIWQLHLYDGEGIHIDANQLMLNWPSNLQSTGWLILDNFDALVQHNLVPGVIDDLKNSGKDCSKVVHALETGYQRRAQA